jgi:hypothetical protein
MTEPKDLFKTRPPGGLDKQGRAMPSAGDETNDIFRILEEKERKLSLAKGLPFLHAWKWYPWARSFYDSTNKINLLCAANQISKSSTQIRKCINWATDKNLWPSLWEREPVQFWYLYPTQKQVNAEFMTKWKLFLPSGEYQDDPYYGYTVEVSHGNIIAIHFKSGVHVYFKTYAQKADALQSGTCDAIFCDEELPVHLYEELMFRISASNGYFNMVFTATLGQDFWRRALEPGSNETEELPQAFKQVVSLYDAMKFEDGTPSHWTFERIKQVEARCSTPNEVLKRVFGKFIVIGGRKYESFDIKRHLKKPHIIPKGWLIYVGADPGSGGQKGHPAALCYVAVRPDFRAGRVFLGWRGDGIETTAGDVVEKHISLINGPEKIQITEGFYDWSSKDFDTISTRMGYPFTKAEKGHDIGEDVINTLFKNDMLFIYETEELMKLAGELASLRKLQRKEDAKDDFADALRYAITRIPWDWSAINAPLATGTEESLEEKLTSQQIEIRDRRKQMATDADQAAAEIENEFKEWNDAYG